MLGVALRPIAKAVTLFLLGCLLFVAFLVLKTVLLIVVLVLETVGAIGSAVVTWMCSEWTAFWVLVAAQILIGALLGFAAGLRAQKPGVSR
jgi:hypothetical protein